MTFAFENTCPVFKNLVCMTWRRDILTRVTCLQKLGGTPLQATGLLLVATGRCDFGSFVTLSTGGINWYTNMDFKHACETLTVSFLLLVLNDKKWHPAASHCNKNGGKIIDNVPYATTTYANSPETSAININIWPSSCKIAPLAQAGWELG